MLQENFTDPFERRGLDPELAAKCGAYFLNGKFYFDYRSRGRVWYRKIRTLDKTFWIEPSGAKKLLWGLETLEDLPCQPDAPLVMTEGEPDRLAALQAWGGYAVSVPNGANGSKTEPGKRVADDEAFGYLWGPDERLIPELAQFQRIILAVDNDAAGMMLRDELALRIGASRCWFMDYPPGCKDLNDVLLRHGAAAVQSVLENARPMRSGRSRKPSEIPDDTFEQTYSTGWTCLDPHLRLIRPELVVVTGIPGHGKGVFTRSLCYNMAEKWGFRTQFWTPEDRASRLKRDMHRFCNRSNGRSMKYSEEWADAHFRITEFGHDEDPTIDALIEEMETAVFHHNCQQFVLDPWNEVSHDIGNISETIYIERTLRRLKQTLRALKLILYIVAHPTKIKDGEKVGLYSINGSSNWKNKCDGGIIVNRMADGNGVMSDICEIGVEKRKDQETMGTPGKVFMRYDRDKANYYPVDTAPK